MTTQTYKTPYMLHQERGHRMTRHSPDGYQIIEECSDCLARFLHDPGIGYPITLYPQPIRLLDPNEEV